MLNFTNYEKNTIEKYFPPTQSLKTRKWKTIKIWGGKQDSSYFHLLRAIWHSSEIASVQIHLILQFYILRWNLIIVQKETFTRIHSTTLYITVKLFGNNPNARIGRWINNV